MMIDLTDTKSSKINAALVQARRKIGSPTLGMVLTLVVVTDEAHQYDAMKAAVTASLEHPSRILVVIQRPGVEGVKSRLDAEVRVGETNGVGETVLLRLHGDLSEHPEAVVLPLLLPDAPVVVWWPGSGPEVPGKDPLGALAQRRITDMVAPPRRSDAIALAAAGYTPGDTDLAWTRSTPWRSLLAAALDQRYSKITGAQVEAKPGNPTAELTALWLTDRLDVPVKRQTSEGPGITSIRINTVDGDIVIARPDAMLATYSVPGQPDRTVALRRRETPDLLSEELRRLDPDDIYEAVLARAAKESDEVGELAENAVRTKLELQNAASVAPSTKGPKPLAGGTTPKAEAGIPTTSRLTATAAAAAAKRTPDKKPEPAAAAASRTAPAKAAPKAEAPKAAPKPEPKATVVKKAVPAAKTTAKKAPAAKKAKPAKVTKAKGKKA